MPTPIKYVICDPARDAEEMPGYGFHSPIEGWIFTYLLAAATRFDSREHAENAMRRHYSQHPQLLVTPVTA